MLQQEKIILRPLELNHKHELARQANNKKIWDNLRDYIPYPYREKDAVEFINMTASENPRLTFGITYEGKFAGVIGMIRRKDVYRHTAELGYWIGEAYWGKGIGTVAVKLATDYAFKELEMVRIVACVFDFNIASMCVLEKNGYVKEGIGRKAVFKNGIFCDEHRYAIVKRGSK